MESVKVADNIDILLRYFKPIKTTLLPNPKTPELLPNQKTSEMPSESDSSIDSHVDYNKRHFTPARLDLGSDTVDCTKNETAAEAELELIPTAVPINKELEKTGIAVFINQYTFDGAAKIFASIKKYPPEFLIKFLNSLSWEMEKTTVQSHYNLLADEVYKLQKQIDQQEEIYKNHLLNIIFNCPESNESQVKIQKKFFQECLTFEQIVDAVLEMKDKSYFIQKRRELESIMEEDDFEDERIVPIIKKLRREITWTIVQELLMPIEPEILKLNCLCCDKPAEFAIYPCGHKCLCEYCKIKFEESETSKCPICRQEIFDMIKIYE